MDRAARPDFVECKAYEYVGASRDRMAWEHVPSFEEVRGFARRLAEGLGYGVEDERSDSRVALLMRPGARRYLWDDPRSAALFGPKPRAPLAPGTLGTPAPAGLAVEAPSPTSASSGHLHVVHEHDAAHARAQGDGGEACGCAGEAARNARLV